MIGKYLNLSWRKGYPGLFEAPRGINEVPARFDFWNLPQKSVQTNFIKQNSVISSNG